MGSVSTDRVIPFFKRLDHTSKIEAYSEWMLGCNQVTHPVNYEPGQSQQFLAIVDDQPVKLLTVGSGWSKADYFKQFFDRAARNRLLIELANGPTHPYLCCEELFSYRKTTIAVMVRLQALISQIQRFGWADRLAVSTDDTAIVSSGDIHRHIFSIKMEYAQGTDGNTGAATGAPNGINSNRWHGSLLVPYGRVVYHCLTWRDRD